MQEINVTANSFETEVLKSEQPVLVDLWAAWCGPCKMLMPVIEELAETQDAIKVCKVNVDDENELTAKYQIASIPTLILFKDGKAVKSLVELHSKAEIENMKKN